MSGPLDNLSSIAAANAEADAQQKLQSAALWRRLELYRLASISSSSSREEAADAGAKEKKLALALLKDVEPRLLFLAVDVAFGQQGDESKRKAVESALLGVCGSKVGPELLDQVCCKERDEQWQTRTLVMSASSRAVRYQMFPVSSPPLR